MSNWKWTYDYELCVGKKMKDQDYFIEQYPWFTLKDYIKTLRRRARISGFRACTWLVVKV